MNKGYRKILIFEIILLFILILNSFTITFLNRYTVLIFLAFLIIVFKKKFGIEKIKKRYTRDIITEILIIYLLFFIIYYLFGLIIGFYKNSNYYTLYAIKEFIFPITLSIILKEYLRVMLITKCDGSKKLFVIACIVFVMIDLTIIIPYSNLSTKEGLFDFFAIYLLPSITRNIVASYIALKSNYLINIFWIIVFELYIYLLPIIPDTGEYILSVIKMLFPFIILIKIKNFFDKESDEKVISRNGKNQIASLVISIICVITIVYFTSGHFKYYSVAIATGSMTPMINRGDVVIVRKTKQYDLLKKGDIIAYNYNNVIVVHRIVEIINEDNNYYFYTKGDANNAIDNYVIYENQILGIVNIKIPYIGLPTVWLNEI